MNDTARLFTELRGLMVANEYTGPQLARRLGIGTTGMSERLNGHKPFTMEEAYEIMDLFHIPNTRLHELFPPQGKKGDNLS